MVWFSTEFNNTMDFGAITTVTIFLHEEDEIYNLTPKMLTIH